jgi:hypothetical protein
MVGFRISNRHDMTRWLSMDMFQIISSAFRDLRLTVTACGWRCILLFAILAGVLVSAFFASPMQPVAGLCRVYN